VLHGKNSIQILSRMLMMILLYLIKSICVSECIFWLFLYIIHIQFVSLFGPNCSVKKKSRKKFSVVTGLTFFFFFFSFLHFVIKILREALCYQSFKISFCAFSLSRSFQNKKKFFHQEIFFFLRMCACVDTHE
jgi:hypothetical protein